MSTQIRTANNAFVMAFTEASDQATKKLNNWVNTYFEINKFNKLVDAARQKYTELSNLVRTEVANKNTNIFTLTEVNDAATIAGKAKQDYEKAAAKAGSITKPGFKEYASARLKLNDLAYSYSVLLAATYSNRLTDAGGLAIQQNVNSENSPVGSENAISSSLIAGILVIVGIVTVVFIFKKLKRK
jgi:hypothetical protein